MDGGGQTAATAQAPPGRFDVLQLLLAVSALIVDALALWAIAARISEFGFSPNRTAALFPAIFSYR